MSWTTRLAGHQSVGEPRSSDPLISPNIASRMQNTFQILGYRLDDLALATLLPVLRLVPISKTQFFATGLQSTRFYKLYWYLFYQFCSQCP